MEPAVRRSLSQQAYDAIYKRIVTMAYLPGQHLEEALLVDQLGIGRTPVREALQRLEADLLVESQPGKGYLVRQLTLQNTKAAFAALQIMELGVAELAVRNDNTRYLQQMAAANEMVAGAVKKMDILQLVEANSMFHHAYACCSQNVYLIQGLQKVRCETNRLAYLSFVNEIDPSRTLQVHYQSVITHHQQIVDALRERDAALVKRLIVEHIDIFKNRILSYLANF
jgi:DNA-binding GntR family transcriptional regulator